MDYNEKLLKLKKIEKQIIEKAQEDGYRLINNQLIKDKYIPVIEVYVRVETEYEKYGSFAVFKKTVPITKEQVEKIKKIKQNEESIVDEFVYDGGILTKIKEFDRLYELLFVGRFNKKSICKIVDDLEEEYSLNDGQNLYLEFFFESNNMNGYISIYDMPVYVVEEIKNNDIDLFFNKYLTDN